MEQEKKPSIKQNGGTSEVVPKGCDTSAIIEAFHKILDHCGVGFFGKSAAELVLNEGRCRFSKVEKSNLKYIRVESTLERVLEFNSFFTEHRDEMADIINRLVQGTDLLSRAIVRRFLQIYKVLAPYYEGEFLEDPNNEYGSRPPRFRSVVLPVVFSKYEVEEAIRQQDKYIEKTPTYSFPSEVLLTHEYGASYFPKWITQIYNSKRSLEFIDPKYWKLQGKDVLDCGANIGDSSLIYSEMGPRCVYAFEPARDTFRALEKVVALNGRHKENKGGQGIIVPVNLATGKKRETLRFFSEGDYDTCATTIPKPTAQEYEVECISVDEYVESNRLEVGLIKMDIQGAEYDSILGATQALRKFKPVLVLSIYHTTKDFFEIKPYLESLNLGYKFLIRQLAFCYHLPAEVELIAYVPDA